MLKKRFNCKRSASWFHEQMVAAEVAERLKTGHVNVASWVMTEDKMSQLLQILPHLCKKPEWKVKIYFNGIEIEATSEAEYKKLVESNQ